MSAAKKHITENIEAINAEYRTPLGSSNCFSERFPRKNDSSPNTPIISFVFIDDGINVKENGYKKPLTTIPVIMILINRIIPIDK